jgi:very-short-patch-repair endonuclease
MRAKQLRKQATPTEKLLWEHLKNRQLNGIKFRRQHVLDPYIVDFYSPAHRLAIEIDGEIHKFQEQEDSFRTQTLEELGIKVIRFWNHEVEHCLDIVLESIINACELPSPTRGRRVGDEGDL